MITIKNGINIATGDSWRLVYGSLIGNGEKAISIIEGTKSNRTSTIYTIEEFETEQMALDRVDGLGYKLIGYDNSGAVD